MIITTNYILLECWFSVSLTSLRTLAQLDLVLSSIENENWERLINYNNLHINITILILLTLTRSKKLHESIQHLTFRYTQTPFVNRISSSDPLVFHNISFLQKVHIHPWGTWFALFCLLSDNLSWSVAYPMLIQKINQGSLTATPRTVPLAFGAW